MSKHLPDHAQGLIMLTGGRDGRLSRLLVEGRYVEARDCLGQLTEWYGSDSVYVELQRNSLDGDTLRNRRLVGLARETGARLVATNAALYHAPERYKLQHALVAIRHNSTIDQQPPSHPAQRPVSPQVERGDEDPFRRLPGGGLQYSRDSRTLQVRPVLGPGLQPSRARRTGGLFTPMSYLVRGCVTRPR